MTLLRACAAFVLAALLAAGSAQAAAPADSAPSWNSPSRPQQSALAPLQHDWASIDGPNKQKWVEVAGRFPRMAPAERQRVQARMAEWARMTPAERTRARLQFQESRELTPGERQAKWQAYQALPEDQRKLLAQRARPSAHAGSAASAVARGRGDNGRHGPAEHAPPNSRAVSPIVVQAAPGATTTTLRPQPPPRPRVAGQGKIAAAPSQVDPATLLPRRARPASAAHPSPASTGTSAGASTLGAGAPARP